MLLSTRKFRSLFALVPLLATVACSSGRYFQFDNSTASATHAHKSVAVAEMPAAPVQEMPAAEPVAAVAAPAEVTTAALVAANTIISTPHTAKHALIPTLTLKQQQRIEKRVASLEHKVSMRAATPHAPAAGLTSEGKSQVVALILAALVGALGVHRFYLGYTGIGIAQLLTLGGCGIWSLIDLVRILTGSLKPKDGDYAKKL